MHLEQTKTIKNYAKRVLERDTKMFNKKDWTIIGEHLNIKPKFERLRPIIAKRQVMDQLELANKTVIDLLLKADIQPNRGLNLLKEAENIARTKENSKDLIAIADRYIDLHDLKPAKIKITESRSNNIDYEGLTKVKQTISTVQSVDNSQKTDSNKD